MRAYSRFHRHFVSASPKRSSTSALMLAFAAGLLMAALKTVAAVVTGSASMQAEAVHSWADTATDGFLVAAYWNARRPADDAHSLGYGRESYVWSLFGAIAMCIVGAQFGIWRGVHQLSSPEAATEYLFGYLVIGVVSALQARSFVQALRFVRGRAAELQLGVVEHVFETSDSQLRMVVTGDFIALVGLAIAALGMGLHQLTGNVAYDAAGSILIGLLMGVTGFVLINLNRRYLAGMPLSPTRRARAIALIRAAPEVTRVTRFFAEFIGPDQLALVVHVGLAGTHTQDELARILRALEQRIMAHKNVGLAVLTLASPDEPDLT
ncbi:MAG: cation transporter [Caldimonas sp.]